MHPDYVVNDLWSDRNNLLISIDGGDRCGHFWEWANYIYNNQKLPILLLVDNSEINGFDNSFEFLSSKQAYIYHCYGHVYGQLTAKQCTSFVTFNPSLMHGAGVTPSSHDQRWGKMNMQ